MHMKGDTTSAQEMTAVELQRAAYQAIARELGAAGLIRFIQEHSFGAGNYTEDRRQWLKQKSVRDISQDIEAWRKSCKSV